MCAVPEVLVGHAREAEHELRRQGKTIIPRFALPSRRESSSLLFNNLFRIIFRDQFTKSFLKGFADATWTIAKNFQLFLEFLSLTMQIYINVAINVSRYSWVYGQSTIHFRKTFSVSSAYIIFALSLHTVHSFLFVAKCEYCQQDAPLQIRGWQFWVIRANPLETALYV